jgi:hypothetical protein
MEKVATRDIGQGNFVIGTTKVRPRVESADGKPAIFKKSQKLNFWMQIYNLGIDQATNKSSATFEYDIVNTATNKPVVSAKESTADLGNTGAQVTLEKTMSLASLEPGQYKVVVKVNDNVAKQQMEPIVAKFAVEQ